MKPNQSTPNLPDVIGNATFTKTHKAAIVLASLSADAASSLVENISDAQLRAFAKAFSELKAVPPQVLHSVAIEFVAEVQRKRTELAGGVDEARKVLGQITEDERSERIFSDLNGGGGDNSAKVWETFETLGDAMIAE